MSDDSKIIDPKIVEKLESSKKAALKRVAENLKSELNTGAVDARHSSHSSGGGRTHTSVVS